MEEKKRIINLVAEGKISAEDAARLLEALNPKPAKTKLGRKLRILITQEGSEKPKLNISIPVKLAQLGVKFIPRNANFDAHLESSNFDFSSINWKEIMDMVSSGEVGDLFNMEVEEDDKPPTTIRIYVE
ncbi:MAG: hypothetical protein HOG24_04485 [Candidatus Cloacimonetes bacterium]|jgi:hypothetical protein|nr:hypothetical protein [Candidatus Cloacimonadota bacterium]